MVKSVIGEIVTYYASSAYQVKTDGTNLNTRKYYAFGNTTVAMRENDELAWLLTDQVNSTTVTASEDGTLISEIKYTAFGEVRPLNGVLVTDNRYTGQREEVEIGLYFYVARWYDPVLAHFLQADTVLPDINNSLTYLRYTYTNNNPINYDDPSGHCTVCIGAGIGALFGGIMYGVTSAVSGRTFRWTDLGVSMAVGAAGGALIGTGIGAASGVAMLAAIGAGTGVLGSELAYQATAGEDFSSGGLIATSTVGGLSGAIIGMLGIPGINPAMAVGGRITINVLAGAADYSLQSLVYGQEITGSGLIASGLIGGAAGVMGEVLPSITGIGGSRTERLYKEGLESTYTNAFVKPNNLVSPVLRNSLAHNHIANGVVDDLFRGGALQTVLSPLQSFLNRTISQ